MTLQTEIKVPQAVIFDQETKDEKYQKNDQTGTQATDWHDIFLSIQSAYGKIWKMLNEVYDTDSLA